MKDIQEFQQCVMFEKVMAKCSFTLNVLVKPSKTSDLGGPYT